MLGATAAFSGDLVFFRLGPSFLPRGPRDVALAQPCCANRPAILGTHDHQRQTNYAFDGKPDRPEHRAVSQALEKEDAEYRVHPEQNPSDGQHYRAELTILNRVVDGNLIAIKSWHIEESLLYELVLPG